MRIIPSVFTKNQLHKKYQGECIELAKEVVKQVERFKLPPPRFHIISLLAIGSNTRHTYILRHLGLTFAISAQKCRIL